MKDGDYYRWSYQQHVIDKRQDDVMAGTLYWCCAKIAIFKNGRLRDIYWSSLSDGRSWTQEDAESQLILTFLANAEDLEPASNPEYYAKENIIDIRHPNMMRGGIYMRKGAKRSREVMGDLIAAKIDDAENEIRRQQRFLDRLREKAIEVETADLEKFWI